MAVGNGLKFESSKLESRILSLCQMLMLFSFLMLWVVVPRGFIFPFVFPRVIFFRILTAIGLALYLALCRINPQKYKPKKNLVTVAVLAFVVSVLLSSVFGVSFGRSFWDSQERMLGAFSILNYAAFYLIMSSIFRTYKEWKTVFLAYIFVSAGVFLWGIVQYIDRGFFLNRDATRIASTLGNPLYVAEHALFTLILCVFIFIKEKSAALKWFIAAVFALGLFNFLGANVRSTGAGFIVGIFSLFAIVIIFGRDYPKVRKYGAAFFAVLVLISGFLYFNRTKDWARSIPVAGRILTINFKGNKFGIEEPRRIAWDIAVKAGMDRFVFGWGQSNYYYAFNKFYNPLSLRHGWNETWFDSAHNLLLNTFAERGVVGLISYLFIFAAPLILLFKNYFRKRPDSFIYLGMGILFFVSHFVHNFFVFESPVSYQYFFLMLGFISAYHAGFEDLQQENMPALGVQFKGVSLVSPVFGTIILLILYFGVWRWNILPAKANNMIFKSMSLLTFSIPQSLLSFEDALKIPTGHKEDVRIDYSSSFISSTPKPQNEEQKQLVTAVMRKIMDELEKAAVYRPLEIKAYMQLGTYNRVMAQLTGDKSYLEKAVEFYDKAIEHSPKRQQILIEKAGMLIILGLGEEGVELLENLALVEPELIEPRKRLAFAYYETGSFQKAADKLLEIFKDGYIGSEPSEKKLFGRIFAQTGLKYPKIEEKFSSLIKKAEEEQNAGALEFYSEILSAVHDSFVK